MDKVRTSKNHERFQRSQIVHICTFHSWTSLEQVAIQAEAETIQEQEEEEDVEDGVRDVALTQVFPSLVQQEDSVADDEEVLKG